MSTRKHSDIHSRSGTVVEHKEESALSFDSPRSGSNPHHHTALTTATIESTTIPENDELVQHIAMGLTSSHIQENSNGKYSRKTTLESTLEEENEISDGNIDDQLYSYNYRPLLFVLISMIIIYFPVLVTSPDDITLFYVHLGYLFVNILLFLIVIPLYAKCCQESTDSIIANGGKLLNRSNSLHSITINIETQQYEVNACYSVIYGFDECYNRFFNIRNISDNETQNKIYNQIAISFAGGFLLLSNIFLLICYSVSGDYTDIILQNMKNNVTFLVFACQLIVSVTLFCQISVHFTQIKDEKRKLIKDDLYVQRLEFNIKRLTEKKIFNKPVIYNLYLAVSFIAAICLWLFYFQVFDPNVYEGNFNRSLVLFGLMMYSIIFVYLVIRLLILYSYSVIIVKQFSTPIKVKTMHQIITYWQLRYYYIDLVLYAFVNLFNRIVSFLIVSIAIVLLYIYFMIQIENEAVNEILDDVIDEDDETDAYGVDGILQYLPIFILIVYVMFPVLYTIHITLRAYELQKKHAKMIHREAIYFKSFQHLNAYTQEMKVVMKSDDIISLMMDIRTSVLNSSPYKIGGITINSNCEVLIRLCFVIFSIVICSEFVY